jgi:hypothetical protein
MKRSWAWLIEKPGRKIGTEEGIKIGIGAGAGIEMGIMDIGIQREMGMKAIMEKMVLMRKEIIADMIMKEVGVQIGTIIVTVKETVAETEKGIVTGIKQGEKIVTVTETRFVIMTVSKRGIMTMIMTETKIMEEKEITNWRGLISWCSFIVYDAITRLVFASF